MASTTWRTDLAAGLLSLVQAYATANPTLLRAVSRRRPAGVPETPYAYIGGRSESLNFTGQIMQRVVDVPVVILDVTPDNMENATRVDALVDALITVFKDNPHGVANALFTPRSVQDIEDDYGGVPYVGAAIVVRCEIQEGGST
jgi:hypothetical protein